MPKLWQKRTLSRGFSCFFKMIFGPTSWFILKKLDHTPSSVNHLLIDNLIHRQIKRTRVTREIKRHYYTCIPSLTFLLTCNHVEL